MGGKFRTDLGCSVLHTDLIEHEMEMDTVTTAHCTRKFLAHVSELSDIYPFSG
jgi:hypothetical protein